ncbi:MAG: helix-turn-helix domain-containing protein [Saprospiraceae bacterium]|nr:helix-turn-helix domain-containing protein [Saprospiraceae bacterium]
MSLDPKSSPLSHNLRFLRKKLGLSQTALAESLGIRRSNIAAYESKNVEPRLKILLKIADYFELGVRTLIESKLDDKSYETISDQRNNERRSSIFSNDSQSDIEQFIQKSEKIHRVLEGFRAFYKFKKEKIEDQEGKEFESLMHDIENFLSLMEHLLQYNDAIIDALSSGEITSGEDSSDNGPSGGQAE